MYWRQDKMIQDSLITLNQSRDGWRGMCSSSSWYHLGRRRRREERYVNLWNVFHRDVRSQRPGNRVSKLVFYYPSRWWFHNARPRREGTEKILINIHIVFGIDTNYDFSWDFLRRRKIFSCFLSFPSHFLFSYE